MEKTQEPKAPKVYSITPYQIQMRLKEAQAHRKEVEPAYDENMSHYWIDMFSRGYLQTEYHEMKAGLLRQYKEVLKKSFLQKYFEFCNITDWEMVEVLVEEFKFKIYNTGEEKYEIVQRICQQSEITPERILKLKKLGISFAQREEFEYRSPAGDAEYECSTFVYFIRHQKLSDIKIIDLILQDGVPANLWGDGDVMQAAVQNQTLTIQVLEHLVKLGADLTNKTDLLAQAIASKQGPAILTYLAPCANIINSNTGKKDEIDINLDYLLNKETEDK